MKYVKLFEQFVEAEAKKHLNEASKSDFKPTMGQMKAAIAGNLAGANDLVRFSTMVLQNWEDLSDEKKDAVYDKYTKLNAAFKKQFAKIREEAAKEGGQKAKKQLDAYNNAADKAKELYPKMIEPLLQNDDSSKSSKGKEEEIKKKVEALEKEIETLDANFEKRKSDYESLSDEDKKKQKEEFQDGNRDHYKKRRELESKVDGLEGQIDDSDE